MISIERPGAPGFLTDEKGKWHKETDSAIKHYKNGISAKSFVFKMYNEPELKNALKLVFVKCAYCESSYGAVFDGDVEHFRPKGKVNEAKPQTPGYYWLANNWDNLLLSCQHCNQRRRHQLFGENSLKALGKLDQFPLSDEGKRVRSHKDSLEEEEKVRLLLNPCKDKPEEHFEYEMTQGVIRPLTDKGARSVEIYGLSRPLLVQERKKQLILLFAQMGRVKRELRRIDSDKSATQKAIFEEELDYLIEYTKPKSIYAGMCRYFVKQFLKENGLN